MTREEREFAKSRIEYLLIADDFLIKHDREALEMAIKALENHDTFMKYAYEQGKQDALSQEPCTDAVSRQWLMRKATERFYTTNYFNHITKMIEEAPSVNPQPCDDVISREDAIEAIANIDETDGTVAIFTGKQVIALLKDLPFVNAIQHTSNASKDVEQHINTLGDAVSRQAVLDGIEELKKSPWATDKRGNGFEYLIIEALDVVKDLCVKQLPSVTQNPKTGHWKRISMDRYTTHAQYWYECNKCGWHNLGNTDYCPNCGARMD